MHYNPNIVRQAAARGLAVFAATTIVSACSAGHENSGQDQFTGTQGVQHAENHPTSSADPFIKSFRVHKKSLEMDGTLTIQPSGKGSLTVNTVSEAVNAKDTSASAEFDLVCEPDGTLDAHSTSGGSPTTITLESSPVAKFGFCDGTALSRQTKPETLTEALFLASEINGAR